MNKQTKFSRSVIFILAHISLGVIFLTYPEFTKYYVLLFTVYGVFSIISKRNTGYNAAHFFAAYMIGLEILMRMTRSTIVWEYGKLAIVIFFFTAFLVEKLKRETPVPAVLYLICLFPSLLFIFDADLSSTKYSSNFELFTYNLSGPIALTFSVIYFYKRKMSFNEFREISYWMILPLITLLVYIILKARSSGAIEYNFSANFQASGGFGPNQVSTVLGLGILILGFAFVFNYKLTYSRYFDIALLIIFFYRGLLTFSRGGVITPIISIVLMLLLMSTYFPRRFFNPRILGIVIIGVIIGYFVFATVNTKTGGFLEERYQGNTQDTEYTGQKKIWSGRDRLFFADIQVFLENPVMGAGLGLAQIRRAELAGFSATSHSELSRLLSEHGLFGIFALSMLILLPWREFRRSKSYYNKAIIVGCVSFAFLSMSHSGMRTVCPSFIYGLALVNIITPTKKQKTGW